MFKTYDEMVAALIEDKDWEVPKEAREGMLMGLEWFLIYL